MVAGYTHLLGIAARQQWDDGTIDLAGDAAAWPALPAPDRRAVTLLVAGFGVGERAVANDIAPFAAAAADEALAACFRAQQTDEVRHARFFDRVAAEVLGARNAAEVRELADPALVARFEARLREMA